MVKLVYEKETEKPSHLRATKIGHKNVTSAFLTERSSYIVNNNIYFRGQFHGMASWACSAKRTSVHVVGNIKLKNRKRTSTVTSIGVG